jgi:hypothetical protein
MFTEGDSIGLLLSIEALVYNYQSKKYQPLALYENKWRFYMIYQDHTMTCQAYMERFQNTVDVLNHCGAAAGNMPGLVNMILKEQSVDPDKASKQEIAKQEAQE